MGCRNTCPQCCVHSYDAIHDEVSYSQLGSLKRRVPCVTCFSCDDIWILRDMQSHPVLERLQYAIHLTWRILPIILLPASMLPIWHLGSSMSPFIVTPCIQLCQCVSLLWKQKRTRLYSSPLSPVVLLSDCASFLTVRIFLFIYIYALVTCIRIQKQGVRVRKG